MPRLITSIPCALFSAILRSSWANRYGGMRSRRLLDLIQLLRELLAHLAGVDGARPAGQVHVQVVADVGPQGAAVEGHGQPARAAPADEPDRGAPPTPA